MSIQEILMVLEVAILAITVITTYYFYFKNKSEEISSRATMLYYQIKEIEGNIMNIKRYCIVDGTLSSTNFDKSKLVFTKNLWEENKFYLSKKINYDEYNLIEKFYSTASTILIEQNRQKKFFNNLIEIKQNTFYNKQIDKIYDEVYSFLENGGEAEKVDKNTNLYIKAAEYALSKQISEYIPAQSNNIIQSAIDEFNIITDGNVYNKIKKIAKIQ